MLKPIAVSSSLASRGWTSEVVTQQLFTEIKAIMMPHSPAESGDQNSREKIMGDNLTPPEIDSRPDITLPNTNMSIRAIARYLLHAFGRKTKMVSGELLRSNDDWVDEFSLHLRLDGRAVGALPGLSQKTASISKLLDEGARKIVWAIYPYDLVRYYYSIEKDMEMVQRLLPFLLTASVATANEVRAVNLEGIVLYEQRKFDEAIKKFEEAIALDDRFVRAYINLGTTFARMGYKSSSDGGVELDGIDYYSEAIRNFRKAVELNPQYSKAYHGWAVVLAEQRNYRLAYRMFRMAALYNPKSALTYHNWGNALAEGGNYDDAISKFQRAIMVDPGFVLAYYGLGNALYAREDRDSAIVQYRKAIEINSEFGWAYYQLGEILVEKDQCYDAFQFYWKAFSILSIHRFLDWIGTNFFRACQSYR